MPGISIMFLMVMVLTDSSFGKREQTEKLKKRTMKSEKSGGCVVGVEQTSTTLRILKYRWIGAEVVGVRVFSVGGGNLGR